MPTLLARLGVVRRNQRDEGTPGDNHLPLRQELLPLGLLLGSCLLVDREAEQLVAHQTIPVLFHREILVRLPPVLQKLFSLISMSVGLGASSDLV